MTPYEIFLSCPTSQRWLRRLEPPAPLTPEQIVEKVCGYFGVTHQMLKHKSRKRWMVTARQISMMFLCQMTPLAQNQIGIMFNRDRTTVINACRVVMNMIETNDPIAKDYEALRVQLNCPKPNAKPIAKPKGRPAVVIQTKYSNRSHYGFAGNF